MPLVLEYIVLQLFCSTVHVMLLPVLNILYLYINTFLSMCSVPGMAVFCSSMIPCVPDLLLTDFLNDFDVVSIIIIIFIIIIIIIIIKPLIEIFCKARVFGNYLFKYSPKIRINKYLLLSS